MARPMKPLVRGGGYYPSNRWIPLVYPGGYTTMNGGGEPTPSVVWVTVSGSSPLALANAASSNIKKLIQTGKCVQSGTPLPSAPVDIMCNNGTLKCFCGNQFTEEDALNGYIISDKNGILTTNSSYRVTVPIRLRAGSYQASFTEAGTGARYFRCWEYEEDGTTPIAELLNKQTNGSTRTFDFSLDHDALVRFSYRYSFQDIAVIPDNPTIYIDGTPEVLSVGAQTASVQNLFAVGDYADTHDIISGAVNRKVGVKVLTGEETMNYASDTLLLAINDIIATGRGLNRLLCTHYRERASGDYFAHHNYSNNYVYFHNVDITSLEDWRAFLAAQYAAGTPVIVLYPLAEETTEQTTPQPLRTEAGDNTVSVVSEVDPVELSVEYAQPESGGS